MKVLANEECQLVSVLNDSRNSRSSAPVVIEMAVLISEQLQSVGRQSVGIVDNIVARWSNGSLPHGLAHKEEVISEIIII